MPWKEALFKGKKVWVEVDSKGNPVVQKGLSPIRYSSDEGAKVYFGKSTSVGKITGEALQLPPVGKSAPKGKVSLGLGSAKNRTLAQKKKAKQTARQLVDSFSEQTIVCFTDGSCRGNPGLSGTGVLVRMTDGREVEHFRFLGEGTNNTAEISAVIDALEIIDKEKGPDEIPVEILTDSKYVVGLIQLGWKAKANRDLVQHLKRQIKIRGNVRLHWVAGHAGIEENERADQLANKAIDGRSS